MTNEDIRYWLQCVDQSPPRPDDDELRDGDSTRLRKRARIEHGTPRTFLPTPAPSTTPSAGHEHTGIDIHAMSSPRKRQRDDGLDDNLEDLDTNAIDATPRPRRTPRRPDWADEDSQGSLSVSSSRASSSISYRSSPTKQYRNAELQDTGFRTASFAVNATRQPASLQALRRELTSISYGDGIFPHGLRDQLKDACFPDSAFRSHQDQAQGPQWRCPSPEFVHALLERAAECLINHEGESSWNLEIHHPLLAWVFRPTDRRRGLLDYRYCTSAQVISHYKPKNAPSKMVDFCIMARPDADSPEQHAIQALCRKRPGLTINHTDWGDLCKNPIAISVETKRQGEHWDKAVLQMGTWHSSQWRSLSWGRRQTPSSLEFLPGIIIQGHDWLFVATTMEPNGAVLYSSVRIGDTETEFGIYKLLVALQCLEQWVENTYWPLFKSDILGISGT